MGSLAGGLDRVGGLDLHVHLEPGILLGFDRFDVDLLHPCCCGRIDPATEGAKKGQTLTTLARYSGVTVTTK
ncbi:hypothetical protein SAMN05444392_10568 [Seinonella peptonophila]|uniref:Uncharacterized protein n=1 Tax=Seinonella peptonophila TaxID=112248 RepID=A0A1M4XLW8_9BACL|nr:hypothetical protein SAMN05444392_10568 [Seinonella peptonophila]